MAFVRTAEGLTSTTTDPYYREGTNIPPDNPDNNESIPEDSFTVDYSEMIASSAYICTYPVQTILDSIKEHFDDYINIEDNLNYVDIFYDQWHHSRKVALEDDREFHRTEILEALENIHQRFIEEIRDLFKTRLTITIPCLEDDLPDDPDDVEFIIRTIYDYFIIDARKNFKTVITKDIVTKLINIGREQDDALFYSTVDGMFNYYSPLVRVLTPEQFIRYSSSATKDDVLQLYDDGKISGNFLRKYTCKLYQNEDLKIEMTNQIVLEEELNSRITSLPDEATGSNE